MKRRLLLVVPFLLVAILALSCGSGGGRQLQSISIAANPTEIGGQFQLVATGHFSSPPTTVTPLPAFWSFTRPPGQYTLTTQPFSAECSPLPGPLVIAWAPVNPNAPSSGSISGTKLVREPWACTDVQD